MTDDLRPELSVYNRMTYTPNFERLSKKGIVFDYAYSQAPVCMPSRHSFLTGSRPVKFILYSIFKLYIYFFDPLYITFSLK